MKRIVLVFVVTLGIAIPLLGDGAQKDEPLVEPDVTERYYVLPDRQSDVLALLLRLYPPRLTEARTEPRDNHLALVVKGPRHVHDAVDKFVDFLNAEQAGKEADAKHRAIKNGRTRFIIKPAKP